jgi:hypothetical protein
VGKLAKANSQEALAAQGAFPARPDAPSGATLDLFASPPAN